MQVRDVLDRLARGELPANIALMHLIMRVDSADGAQAAIRRARSAHDGVAAERLDAVSTLLNTHPHAFELVQGVMGSVDHQTTDATPRQALAALAQAFDAAARRSPDGGSALYALGDPQLLQQAADEVAARMRGWGLLGPGRRMVEVGCGSGRHLATLAPEMALVVGAELSSVMAAAARAATAGLDNVGVVQCEGSSLGFLADASVDLVLYADSFPYLVQAGGELAARHLAECARVLSPSGTALILNASYRGDIALDRSDLTRWCAAAGLTLARVSVGDFSLWDAPSFLIST